MKLVLSQEYSLNQTRNRCSIKSYFISNILPYMLFPSAFICNWWRQQQQHQNSWQLHTFYWIYSRNRWLGDF